MRARVCVCMRVCHKHARDQAVEALESCIGAVLANKSAVMHIGLYSTTNSQLVAAEQEAASRPVVFDEPDFDHVKTIYGGEAGDATTKEPAAAVGTVLSPLKLAALAIAAQEETEYQDEIDADPLAACKRFAFFCCLLAFWDPLPP